MKSGVIYITYNLIRYCELGENPEKPKFAELNISSLKKEEIPQILKNFVKNNKIQPEYLILGIPRNKVNIHYFSFPSTNDNEINSMVDYELNSSFVYKEEELVCGSAIIEKLTNGFSRVIMAVVPRKIILPVFSLLKHAGLVPDEALLSSVSLFNQLVSRKKTTEKCLVVYFDDGFADILYISGNNLEFSRAINFESNGLDSLLKEIKNTVSVLNFKNKKIERIIIGGKSLFINETSVFLEKVAETKIEIKDSLDTLKGFIQENGGLQISLLPEEFKIHKVKESRARSLILLGILLFLNISLIANIVFFKIKAKDEYLFGLKSEINKIDNKAVNLQKKMIKARALRSYINAGRMKLGLLSEIYRAAPEGITLNSLDISGNKKQGSIVLVGQASNSDNVLKFNNNLKASPFIEKTDVSYINKRNLDGQNAADFEIRATY